MRLPAILILALAAASAPASAADEIVAMRGWSRVAYAEGETCRAEVRGNGKVYRVAGTGFVPGETVHFRLTNEDIVPVVYRDHADLNGDWRRFYLPFLWHRQGGAVTVNLISAHCALTLSFDWARARPDAS